MQTVEEGIEKKLRSISYRIRCSGREVLRDFPITPAQFDVLQYIFFNGDKRMTDVSNYLGITKSTTTGLVQRIVELGYLKKEKSNRDRRSYIIKITNSGKRIIQKVIERRVEYIKHIIIKIQEDKVEKLNEILSEFLDITQKK